MLMREGSRASFIYIGFRLSRCIIKAAFTRLQSNRRGQTVLASIVCATRFKLCTTEHADTTVKCLRCGEPDSFEHLVNCCGWRCIPPMESVDSLLNFLVLLTREAEKGAPLLPIKYPMPEIDEISLAEWPDDASYSPSAPQSSLDSLSFEGAERGSATGWTSE